MDPAEYDKTRAIITFFTSTILIFTTFYNFHKGIQTYNNMKANAHQIQDLISNWNSQYIVDFQVINGEECPEGYQSLVNY